MTCIVSCSTNYKIILTIKINNKHLIVPIIYIKLLFQNPFSWQMYDSWRIDKYKNGWLITLISSNVVISVF